MNPKAILALSVLGLMIASNAFVGYKAYQAGKDAKQAEWNKSISDAKDDKIQTRTKQDEIYRAPLDGSVTDRRLLNGTF